MEIGNPQEPRQTQPIPAKRPADKSTAREWVTTLAMALILAWIIRSFLVEPFIVVGASMDPTFATGQFLLVDRITYRFTAPQRDDVIVFHYPKDPTQDYIKRIIGLPGETVTIADGHVSVQTGASSTPIALNEPFIDGSHASHDTFTETLGSTEYFVMGDNRLESSDSRVWGPLPADLIVGRPLVRLTPLTQISVLPGAYHQ